MADLQISRSGKKDIRRVSAGTGRRQGDRVDVFGNPITPYGKREAWGSEAKGEQICDREWSLKFEK